MAKNDKTFRSAVTSYFNFLSQADEILQRWVILSFCLVRNEITQKSYHLHSFAVVAIRMWKFPGKRNAKCLHIAQGVSPTAAFIHIFCTANAGCIPDACHSDSHTSIFCIWVVQLHLICGYFPLYFKSGLECTKQSFGSAQTWITYIRIQKWMDVKSEARAEKSMFAQRAEKIRVTVACEAIAVIV